MKWFVAALLMLVTCLATSAVPPPATPANQAFKAFQAAVATGQVPKIRAAAQDFSVRFPADPRVASVLFQQGAAERRAGFEPEARATWARVLSGYPGTEGAALAIEQLAILAEKRGQRTEREALFNRLVREYPKSPVTLRVFRQEAQAKLAARDYERAVAAYQKIADSLTEADRTQLKFARAMATAKGADPTALLKIANELLASNDVATAIALYEELLRRFPTGKSTAEAKTKLGWCYALQRDWDRAERLWQEVIATGPPQDAAVGESRWHIVQLLSGPRGKWEKAATLCDEIIKSFPVGSARHEQAMFSKAWLYWAHKKWAVAKEAFESFIAAYPEKATHPPIVEYLEECVQNLAGKAAK